MSGMINEELNCDILVSGSCDTSVKVWDVKEKKCMLSLKGHRAQVNDVKISPDGGWVASCGNDKRIIVWDIKNGAVIRDFDTHTAPVSTLVFNPQELALAASGADKYVTYYSLENTGSQILGKTRKESSPIESIQFDAEGQFLFSASQDSLKVWNIEDKCKLAGSFEAKWRGIKDLKMNQKNTQLYGLTVMGSEFSMWMTEWRATSPISPPTHEGAVMHHNQNLYNRPTGINPTGSTTHVTHYKKIVKKSPNNPSSLRQVESDLRASRQPDQVMDYSMVKKIRKEHKKFTDLMQDKQNYLKPIVHWLNSGKIIAAVNAIEK